MPWLLMICGGLVLALIGFSAFRRVRDPLPVAFVLVGLTWLGLPNLVPRPVLFSFVLLALLVVVLDVQAGWAAPLVLWVWAGLHGSFVLGLGLLVLDAIRRRVPWRKASVRVIVSLAAVSLTAHGLGVWSMLMSFAANRDALRFISEWAVPDVLSIPVAPYALMVVGLLAAAALGRLEPRDLWVVGPFLLFGLTSARAILPAAIVLAPFAASVWRVKKAPEAVARSPARANLLIGVLSGIHPAPRGHRI